MSDWLPPAADFDDVKMGEGLDASMRVSDATQAARDRQSGWLRATYESSGDPTGLGTVEPRIQKAAGGKAKPKSTWQPPAEDFAAPDVFAESKQQPEPKSVSLIDQLIQPWKGESLGSLYEQNAYVRWHDYNQKVNAIAGEIRGKNPDIGPLELATQATDAYRQKYGKPAEMDINWAELPHRLYQQITEQPAAFISQMAKGMVTDPQMFLATASGNALVKAAKIGSQFGVQATGMAGAKELQEQGAMSPQAVMQEGVSGSLMGGVLSLAHSALSVGLQSAKPGKVTPEVERAAAERFDESVAEGLSPDLAMTRVMRENGMEAEKAEAVGAAISPVNRALDDVLKLMKGPEDASSERIKPESNLDEHPPGDQGGTPAEAGGSDRVQRGGQEAEVGTRPVGFTTAKGSRYLIHEDGTTTRDKALRAEHPGDQGIKPRSTATFYVDEAGLTALGEVQTRGAHKTIAPAGDGQWAVKYVDGKDAGKLERRTLTDVFVEPEIGRYPVEIWGDGSVHFGNEIVSVKSRVEPGAVGRGQGGIAEPRRIELTTAKGVDVVMERQGFGSYKLRTPDGEWIGGINYSLYPDGAWKPNILVNDKFQRKGVATAVYDYLERNVIGEKFADRGGQSAAGQAFRDARKSGPVEEPAPPKVSDELRRLQDYERRVQTDVEGLTGEAKYQALRDTSAKIAELQGGKADPKLLAMLGLGTAGGVAAWALTQEPEKAIGAALLAGSLPMLRTATTRLTNGITKVNDRFFADTRFDTKDIFRQYAAERAIGPQVVDKWADAMKVARGDPVGIKGAAEAVAAPWARKAREDRWIAQRDAMQGHEDAKAQLNPRERMVNDQLRKMNDQTFVEGERHGVLREYYENYLAGIYAKPSAFESWGAVADWLMQEGRRGQGGMSRHTRHAMQKVFPDYRTVDQLRAEGKIDLKPLTNDPIEITRMSVKAVQSAITNKRLLQTLEKSPGPLVGKDARPIPLAVPITTEGAARRIIQGNAILRDKFDLDADGIKAANRFDIMRAPSDYVPVNHPAFEGYRFYKGAADSLKLLVDTRDPNIVARGAYATSMTSKAIMFMASPFFHMFNLSQVAAPYAIRHPSFVPNVWKAARLRAGETLSAEAKDAMTHGLVLSHGVEDFNTAFGHRLLEIARTKLGNVTPGRYGESVPAALQEFQKGFQWMLWNVTQPSLKLGMYLTDVPAAIAKNARQHLADPKGVPLKDPATIKREVSTAVNGSFGGINWFELANNVDPRLGRSIAGALYSPSGRRLMQTLLIAPDWLHASMQAWTKGIAASTPFTKAKSSDSLYRTVLWGQVAMYAMVADYFAQKWTGHSIVDQDDWTYVDRGDGTKMQFNKHLMEMVHMIQNPSKFWINKLSFLPKETLDQAFGRDYFTYMPGKNGKDAYFGPKMKDDSAIGRIAHALFNFGVPIAGKTFLQNPDALTANTLGIPQYGIPYEKRIQEWVDRAEAKGKSGADARRKAERYYSPEQIEKRRDKSRAEQRKQ